MTTRADETRVDEPDEDEAAATTVALRLRAEIERPGRRQRNGAPRTGERNGSARAATVCVAGSAGAAPDSAGAAATRTGSGGGGGSGALATWTGGGSGAGAGGALVEPQVAAVAGPVVRRGRRRKRTTRSSRSAPQRRWPSSPAPNSQSYWLAIRRCEGSPAIANRPILPSAQARHNRLSPSRCPCAFMSRTSATREDTSITRPA